MEKVIKIVEKYVLLVSIAVLPVFVLLNSSAPALTPKLELLVIAGSLAAILWVVRTFIKGEVSFASGKYDFGVLLTAVAFLAATILRTPNKMEAFLIPGVTSFLLAAAFFYFLVNQLGKKDKAEAVAALMISGLLLSLTMIFAGLGVFAKIPQLPALLKDPIFNPMGGLIPVGIYLIPLIFLGVSLVVKDKDIIKKIFWGASTAVIIMALIIVISNALPGKPQFPKFPSLQTSWEVAVGVVAKSPVFGAGPGNYLSAFNQYRPVSYNQTDLWSVRFTTANNFYLTLVTEVGLLGLAAFLIILFSVYRSLKGNPNLEKLSLVAFLLILAVFPASPVIFVPLFILLAIFSGSEDKVVTLTTVSVGAGNKVTSKALSIVLGLLILAGVGAVDFFGAKIAIAEYTYAKSLTALGRNDFKGTFDLIQKAITQNPKVDRYHASLAQLDMALAQSLANKKDISADEKTTITQLVQQAINEGKNTVALNPGRSGNWEVLAQIYRTIMPFAQGADQFAVQTYNQAIALDPTNPNLRIALGGVYYALGRYDDAIEAFKLAVLAKPDLANAHYNLAIAFREKKNFDGAINEMNTVLSLVAKDSQDYTLAKNTLDELEAASAKATAPKEKQGETLTAPKPVGTSSIKPPITLPVDSTPPTPNP